MANDSREVLYNAKEHTNLVNSILAESRLKPYNIFRHVNVSTKRVVDLGCGDAEMSRESLRLGASFEITNSLDLLALYHSDLANVALGIRFKL